MALWDLLIALTTQKQFHPLVSPAICYLCVPLTRGYQLPVLQSNVVLVCVLPHMESHWSLRTLFCSFEVVLVSKAFELHPVFTAWKVLALGNLLRPESQHLWNSVVVRRK